MAHVARQEPYFNMHGGGPGNAPAMTRDFKLPPGGITAMDRFQDRDAHYLAGARKREAANDNRKTLAFGRNSTVVPSIAELRSFKSMVAESRSVLSHESVAVYVAGIDAPSCVKIGKARSPHRRLATLQTGNHDTLFLHRVFWLPDAEAATSVEGMAHEYAAECHFRLEGEWFECIPYQAHNHVQQAVDDLGLDYCAMSPNAESTNAAS